MSWTTQSIATRSATSGVERSDEAVELRPSPAEDGRRATTWTPQQPSDPVDDVGGLVLEGVQARDGDLPRAGVRSRRELRDRDGRSAHERPGEAVGDVEDGPVVAPARRQGPNARRRRVDKLASELREGRRAGAAPAIDRLVGIPHGGDRHRLTRGDEQ